MKKGEQIGKNYLKYIGNGLIAASLIGFIWIFYPLIYEELAYRLGWDQQLSVGSEAFSLSIPAIRISANVVEDVDPFNRQEYREALTRGVAHAKTLATPNEAGTVYLFAHSSDTPWNLSRYNRAFFRLNRLNPGDEIRVIYSGNDYQYRVRELKTVWPNEVEYLTDSDEDQLILQTCTPIGTDFKRLLVLADLISTD